MFRPTHYLVSRSRKTPVQLQPGMHGFRVLTESEWLADREPAFELRVRQGFFCQGVPVVGYALEPIDLELPPIAQSPTSQATEWNQTDSSSTSGRG